MSGTHLQWFESYLTIMKHYTQFDHEQKKKKKKKKTHVPQRSILGSLFFLLCTNNLQFDSDLIEPIMFADDTNLFYSNKDINTVFLKVNNELQKINEWFVSNRSN